MKKILLVLKTKIGILILSTILIAGIGMGVFFNFNNNKKGNDNKCVVDFETNGGTKISSQKVDCGSKIERPKNPSKNGFEFDNWYLNGKKFNFSSIINKSIIINAVYKEKAGIEYIEVAFDTDGGSKIDNIKIKKGEELTSPVNPTKDGYKFEGWFLNDTKFDFKTKLNENITLTAKWEKEKKSSKANSNNSNKKNNNDIKESTKNSNQKSNSNGNNNGNSDNNSNEKSNSKKNTISLSTSSISVSTGTTSTFTMSYTPSDSNWLGLGCNSNNGNASVTTYSADNVYTVTGIHPGNSIITCYNENGGQANRVTKKINVSVSKTSVTDMILMSVGRLEVGHTGHMSYQIVPQNAYDKTATWSSSNPAIASIDNNGNITGHSIGTVTITARANDGGITKSTNVEIYERPKPTSIRYYNCPYNVRHAIGEQFRVGAVVNPENTSSIRYESGNGNAIVNQDGYVTRVDYNEDNGEIIIWAIAVENPELKVACTLL